MASEMSAKQAARELRHMRAGIKYALTLPVVSDEDKEDREIDEIQVTALNMGIKALEKDEQAAVVPISELKRLRKEMDEIIYETAEGETILWTCESMIDSLLEAYEKKT